MTNLNIGKNLSSSLVVFLVALPLCMGVAMASGASVIQGIMAGVIGGIVVGALSGSHVSVSGPAAGLIVIVEGAYKDLSAISTENVYAIFGLVVVLAGVFQLIIGTLKWGVIADFIPVSVVKGMLAAIGIMMILKQIPHLVGYDKVAFGDEEFIQKDGHNTLSELFYAFQKISPTAILIGILGLVIQFSWELPAIKKNQLFQWFPAPLIVVVMGVLVNQWMINYGEPSWEIKAKHMVNVPILGDGSILSSIQGLGSQFHSPYWSAIGEFMVWKLAFIIAIIASIETLLSLEAGDKIDPLKRLSPPNKELIAQGIGNTLAGFIGALPITAVIVRTSANVNAGATNKYSSIFHGLWLLVFVLFAPHLINLIPLSALAAILTFVGYKLAKPSLLKEQKARGMDALIPFVGTIIAILFTDLLIGIAIGLILGYYFVLKSNFHKTFSMVSSGNNLLLRFHNQVTFMNKSVLRKELVQIPEGASLILDFSNSTFIDNDITDVLNDFIEQSSTRNITVQSKFHNDKQRDDLKSRILNLS